MRIQCLNDNCEARGVQRQAPDSLEVSEGLHVRPQYMCPICGFDMAPGSPRLWEASLDIRLNRGAVEYLRKRSIGRVGSSEAVQALYEAVGEALDRPGPCVRAYPAHPDGSPSIRVEAERAEV